MKKLTLLLTSVFLASSMVACTDKSTDAPAPTETIDLPTIDMVATHAINLEFSVAQLTFVPNSAAPWLGRIILLDDAGHLYSTDIEGRDPKPVGSSKYIDIFGLTREAAPGVFLAITNNNKIEAFTESDDKGNFSPMIYSGENIDAKRICLGGSSAKGARVLTTDKKINEISLEIHDKAIEQTIFSTTAMKQGASNCFSSTYDKNTIEINTDNNQVFLVKPNKLSKLVVLDLRPIENSPNNEYENGERRIININNGLSVRGVDHVKYIATTPSNYGGGAYADGVLALIDKDENRIVFISLSYVERQLRKAVNLPEDVPQ